MFSSGYLDTVLDTLAPGHTAALVTAECELGVSPPHTAVLQHGTPLDAARERSFYLLTLQATTLHYQVTTLHYQVNM